VEAKAWHTMSVAKPRQLPEKPAPLGRGSHTTVHVAGREPVSTNCPLPLSSTCDIHKQSVYMQASG